MGMSGPKQNPKAIGERSQVHIMYRLLDLGYEVLTPCAEKEQTGEKCTLGKRL